MYRKPNKEEMVSGIQENGEWNIIVLSTMLTPMWETVGSRLIDLVWFTCLPFLLCFVWCKTEICVFCIDHECSSTSNEALWEACSKSISHVISRFAFPHICLTENVPSIYSMASLQTSDSLPPVPGCLYRDPAIFSWVHASRDSPGSCPGRNVVPIPWNPEDYVCPRPLCGRVNQAALLFCLLKRVA